MMKQILLTAAFLLLLLPSMWAQELKITGTVSTSEDNSPLIGVSVVVVGTSTGTISDADGAYSISVQPGQQLSFSFIGYQTKMITVADQTQINVTLDPDAKALDEVVVTALGVARKERSLGYAVQEVKADDIAVKDPTSVSNSLQGRVAGVQIKSGSGTVGGSSSVVVRGMSSLGGTNQPLYVVDGTPIANFNFSNDTEGYDYGNGAQDINPEDVESVSVLKGAAATTLYGNRGANGVILITTKSGARKKGIGVEVNSNVTFENVYILPNFQNEYGGGSSLNFPTFAYDSDVHGPEWQKFDGTPVVETGTDESWGPKMDGTEVLHWHSFVPESDTYNQTRPFSPQADNYKKLFDTGVTLSNTVAMTGGDQDTKFRIGYTNVTQSGVVPNSELRKTMISFKGSSQLHKRVKAFTSFNYVKQNTRGRSQFGYNEAGENVAAAFRIWSQRSIDTDMLRRHYYSDAMGQQVGWNFRSIADGRTYMRWSNNPFWTLNNIYATDDKDRIYGNVGLQLSLIEGLTLTMTGRTDFYTLDINNRKGSGGTDTDYYGESSRNAYENNFEAIANYTKRFGTDWSLTAIAGGNIRYNQYKSYAINTVDGLVIPNFFSVSNSTSPAASSSYYSESQVNSLFASASVGYKDMLYLDLATRTDWSSTLPIEDGKPLAYTYPSVSGSFVFSELLKGQNILSFGKLRAGYAFAGNDTYAYRLYNAYELSNFGETTTFTVSNSRNNPKLKNETTKEFEVGLEAKFINNRVGFQVNYFDRKASDQIIALDVSATSGYSNAIINAGEVQNTGLEAVLYATPLRTKDFSWDISLNYSTYKSKINSLYGDLKEYLISDVGSAWVTATVGEEYGILYAYNGYQYDDNGNKLVGANGLYLQSGEPQKIGSILPDFNGGVMNTLTYKGVSLSALVDFQVGGYVYSIANRWGTRSGQTAMTVGLNDKGNPVRDDVANGGGVRADGVLADGTPNTTYVSAKQYYSELRRFVEEFTYDASFVKLRELKLGYTLPRTLVSRVGLGGASVSIIARNVALLHSNADGFDPEQVNSISNSSAGYESGSLPSTRSVGFNINLKF